MHLEGDVVDGHDPGAGKSKGENIGGPKEEVNPILLEGARESEVLPETLLGRREPPNHPEPDVPPGGRQRGSRGTVYIEKEVKP